MEKLEFKRKIYDELLLWNQKPNKVPLIIDGLRQVGKRYIVSKFANEQYENVIIYDFRHNRDLRKIFEGNLDVDSIIRKSAPYFPNVKFVPYKTILVFEEIGDCPLARTSLKSFALDKLFSVIGTGNLLGVLNFRRRFKAEIPTGYEQIIQMNSLDFEEFLWANGLSEENIEVLKKYVKSNKELPLALANNYIESRNYLEGLIKDYKADFGRFVNDDSEEDVDYHLQLQLNKIFDSIPSQLARETDTLKFKYSDVKKGGRASEFEEPFEWLEKAGLVLRCYNVHALEKPLEANASKVYFKAFISDIGLLMAMYPVSTSQAFLNDNLDSRKGAIFENLAAIMLNKSGFPLYYFSSGANHLEIDFIIENIDGIILIEEKSVNGKMAASRAVMEGRTQYKAVKCFKIIKENFGEGSFYTSIPHYAFPFLLEDMKTALKKGFELPPLKYPSSFE